MEENKNKENEKWEGRGDRKEIIERWKEDSEKRDEEGIRGG
jgi:hypothetical protein